MFKRILSEKTRSNLEALKRKKVLKKFYLAGDTGLALQLKHRISIDLDFFTERRIILENLIQQIKNLGKFSVEKEAENTLIGNFRGTRLSFFVYDYPLLSPLKEIEEIKVADIKDIGCMKISAISSRGTKKDFIDLFFICQEIPLEKMLELFKKKYREIDYNMMHILKSLVYFENARKDPSPEMLISVSWNKVENFFKEEVKKIQ